HLALISSVAGYRGLPRSLAYGPSKAALINFSESVRPDLEKFNIGLTVINPGFVDTEMTRRNDFPMPWIMTPEKACNLIIKGLKKGKFEIAFPWQMVALLKFARILPYPLYFWFIRIFFSNKRQVQ
ncbi:MAG: SDR family NAD(P)-dependent oxidoreductase, partial [Desulfobulbia bacterium]